MIGKLSANLAFISGELEKLRFAGLDQNPMGIRDLLGSAIFDAKRLEEKVAELEKVRDAGGPTRP